MQEAFGRRSRVIFRVFFIRHGRYKRLGRHL